MTYDEIINAVENGAKFTINFQKRTCRVNGKVVMSEEDKPKDTPYLTHAVVLFVLNRGTRHISILCLQNVLNPIAATTSRLCLRKSSQTKI